MIQHFYIHYDERIETVYGAYKNSIIKLFKQDVEGHPFHTVVFMLKPSFKYNMNGGICSIHFRPYKNGTVVDVGYSIAQFFAAKCDKHNADLTKAVEKYLDKQSEEVDGNSYAIAKFCTTCGAEFEESDLSCRNCGTRRT